MNDSINVQNNVIFQYMCSLCDSQSMNKSEFNDHSRNCSGSKHKSNQIKLSIETEEPQDVSGCEKSAEDESFSGSTSDYEISSEIISENEVLITLKHNVGNRHIVTNTNTEKDIPDADTHIITISDEVMEENLSNPNKAAVIENAILDLDSDDNNVRILTVLDPVQINNQFNTPDDGGNEKSSTQEKPQTAIEKDVEPNRRITRNQKNKKQDNSSKVVNKPISKRMYQVIPEEKKTPPTYGVYDFYDEEEEMLKQKKLEAKKKLNEMKSRVCKFCNVKFEDPIDLLRHKREKHTFSRVYFTRKELEPYFNVEDKTKCPLCEKPIGTYNYKVAYRRHIITHSNEYNFQCKICNLRFRRKDQVLSHERRHIIQSN